MFSSFTRLCLEDMKVKRKLVIKAYGTFDKTTDPNNYILPHSIHHGSIYEWSVLFTVADLPRESYFTTHPWFLAKLLDWVLVLRWKELHQRFSLWKNYPWRVLVGVLHREVLLYRKKTSNSGTTFSLWIFVIEFTNTALPWTGLFFLGMLYK